MGLRRALYAFKDDQYLHGIGVTRWHMLHFVHNAEAPLPNFFVDTIIVDYATLHLWFRTSHDLARE